MDQRTTPVLDAVSATPDFGGAAPTVEQAVVHAEALLADATGARQTVFAGCGCHVAMHAAVLAVARPGTRVAVDHSMHRSVVSGLILAGAEPVWLRPGWDPVHQINRPAGPADVAAVLAANPGVSAVLVRTPTVYGIGADVRTIARTCHREGVALVVDEPDGTYFPFHPDLPTPAVQARADLVVNTVPDGGACPASVVLADGGLVDPAELRRRLDLITAENRNPAAYAAIDGHRRHMVADGRRVLGEALDRVARLRARLERIPGLTVVGESVCPPDRVVEWDPLKVVVDVSALAITGYQAQAWLARQHQVTAGFADARRVVFPVSPSGDDAAVDRVLEALRALAEQPPTTNGDPAHAPNAQPARPLPTRRAMSLRDAYFADSEPVTDPMGRISAEMISPCPPGAPVILPGELFTADVVLHLRQHVAAGLPVADAGDPRLHTFRVVRASQTRN
ncbi:aminotransferase class I/II-fold pyridoxal phosphate-dependent enzyme [Actinoplanes siamensis]|uniref:Ornithine decarboxylase n=1 Tax=Actinoplanes siamensis TaxID=1223317 RepID=A0A919NDC5_9ACTN|nr:hypothetical protein [Actinoplanes siamensis]GIF09056.1 ornithine decarboxylase [Actinoplanes siamensis]